MTEQDYTKQCKTVQKRQNMAGRAGQERAGKGRTMQDTTRKERTGNPDSFTSFGTEINSMYNLLHRS